MNFNMKFLFFVGIYIFSFSLNTFSQNNTKIVLKINEMADEELVLKFGANEAGDRTKIAVEIYNRGEKMIPFLMKLKGNRLRYNGYCLGDPKGADSIALIPSIEGSVVYIEVAAIYLINAIYFNSLHFANVPYLSDRKQDKVMGFKGYNYNSAIRIKKAWESTEKWFDKFKKEGLDKLRNDKEFPLKSNQLYFVGTNPNRKRDFLPCK